MSCKCEIRHAVSAGVVVLETDRELLDKTNLAWHGRLSSLVGLVSLMVMHKNLRRGFIIGARRLTSSDNL